MNWRRTRSGFGLLPALLVVAGLLGCQALQGDTPCATDDECPARFSCDLATGLCRELASAPTDASVSDAAATDLVGADQQSPDAGSGDRWVADAAASDLGVTDSQLSDQQAAPDHGDGDLDATLVALDVYGEDRAPEDSGSCGACSAELPICGPGNICVQCTDETHCDGRTCSAAHVCGE